MPGALDMRVLYAEAAYGTEEIEAVVSVLEDSAHSLMTGSKVGEFEASVAKLFGKELGLMVNSGSSANMLAVAALDLPEGSEVITPALTFSTTVAPLVQQRLVPAFVDVEDGTYNVDASLVEEMIGPRTAAMMIPNLIGNLPDWHTLRGIADEHDLLVIEDSADTIGSLFDNAPTGTLSDVSTTSFYASHIVTGAGFGGMVCTSDREIAERARLLRGWGRSSSLLAESERIEDRFNVEVDGIPYDAKFVFAAIGYNFLPSELSAAFGLVQLERLGEYIKTRKSNFEALAAFFAEYSEWFILPRQHDGVESPWLALPLTIKDDAPFDRRALQIHFESAGVQTRTVFTGNILRQPGFRGIERREAPAGYPRTDKVMRGGMLLGVHQLIDERQLDHMMDTFRAFSQTI